jgi:hypothetical protein
MRYWPLMRVLNCPTRSRFNWYDPDIRIKGATPSGMTTSLIASPMSLSDRPYFARGIHREGLERSAAWLERACKSFLTLRRECQTSGRQEVRSALARLSQHLEGQP